MNLPEKIHPNPLISTAVELRYSSDLNSQELLSKIYSKFQDSLPNLKLGEIPSDIKDSNEQWKFTADYILSNDDFSLSVSSNSISFENVSDYKLWGNYFPFIKESLKVIFDLNFINSIDRVGVRYTSILDTSDSLEDAFIKVPTLAINNCIEKFSQYQCNISKEDCSLALKVIDNVKASNPSRSLFGVLVDIDAYVEENVLQDKVFAVIDKLHTLQKELFFSLLKSDYIDNLNPTYS